MAKGCRERFTKLLVLDFLASSLYLSTTLDVHQWLEMDPNVSHLGYSVNLWPERDIIWGQSDVSKFVEEGYYDYLSLCARVLQELQNLADAIDFVVKSLSADVMSDEQSDTTQRGNGTGGDGPRQQLFVLQQMCHQHRNNAARSIERLNLLVEGRNKTLNIHESKSVKRLTVLATIFLPLSLSTSILSMEFRFKDLQLRLYDFLGVFTIIGTAALLLLLLVRAMPSIEKSFPFRGISVSLRELLHLKYAFSYPTHVVYLSFMRPMMPLAVLFLLWFVLAWVLLLVSFIFGMVEDVMLGLKILGFGFAGLTGYALVGFGFWAVFKDHVRKVIRRDASTADTSTAKLA